MNLSFKKSHSFLYIHSTDKSMSILSTSFILIEQVTPGRSPWGAHVWRSTMGRVGSIFMRVSRAGQWSMLQHRETLSSYTAVHGNKDVRLQPGPNLRSLPSTGPSPCSLSVLLMRHLDPSRLHRPPPCCFWSRPASELICWLLFFHVTEEDVFVFCLLLM